MKKLFKYPITGAVFFIIGLVILLIIFFKSCTHEVTYKGTVISHYITSTRAGDIRYYTVARFNDKCIRSLNGLDYYVVEIGGIIYYTETELNK